MLICFSIIKMPDKLKKKSSFRALLYLFNVCISLLQLLEKSIRIIFIECLEKYMMIIKQNVVTVGDGIVLGLLFFIWESLSYTTFLH